MDHNPSLFGITQKSGDPDRLCGNLIAYALIEDYDQSEQDTPLDDLVQNDIIAVTGDYQTERSLKDFLNKEFGKDADKGFEELIDQLKKMDDNDLESDENLQKKFESFNNMEIIPVPARIIFYDSEEELLNSAGDIFFLGSFKSLQNAHLSVTSFPILYQGIYREQQSKHSTAEISDLLTQIETTVHTHTLVSESWALAQSTISKYGEDLQDLLLNEALPKMIYHLKDPEEYNGLVTSFKLFMKPYSVTSDVEKMLSFLEELKNGSLDSTRRLELMCEKISAIHNEAFEKLKRIQSELRALGVED
ncbi:MAG: hypothetical protein OCD01_01795 [Fibrobacterales bacterium]